MSKMTLKDHNQIRKIIDDSKGSIQARLQYGVFNAVTGEYKVWTNNLDELTFTSVDDFKAWAGVV